MSARAVLIQRLNNAMRLACTSVSAALIGEVIKIVSREPSEAGALGAERTQLLEDAVLAAEHVADAQAAIASIDRWLVQEGLRDRPDPKFRRQREPAVEWPEDVQERLRLARANRATALNVLGDRLDALRSESAEA